MRHSFKEAQTLSRVELLRRLTSQGSSSCDASHAALKVLQLKAEGLGPNQLSDYAKKRFAYQTDRESDRQPNRQRAEMDGFMSCYTLQPRGVCVMFSIKALNTSQLGGLHFKYSRVSSTTLFCVEPQAAAASEQR
ncbi:hypothetical protein ACLKA7_002050 [Drosophila subpalustris]